MCPTSLAQYSFEVHLYLCTSAVNSFFVADIPLHEYIKDNYLGILELLLFFLSYKYAINIS